MELEQKCEADGPVGAAIIVVAALFAGGIVLLWKTLLPAITAMSGASPSGPSMAFINGVLTPTEGRAPSPLPVVLLLIALTYCVLLMVAGVGIRSGQKQSFDLAIVLCALLCLFGSGVAVFSGFTLVYCVLRRARVFPIVRP